MSLENLHTEKRLPASLRKTIFQTFLESISEEIVDIRKKQWIEKTGFYNVDTTSMERLTDLCKTFDVPFFTIVRDDIEFLREETRNMGFKIFYKGTPQLYKSFFPTVDRLGDVYVYMYNSAVEGLYKYTKNPIVAARKKFDRFSKGQEPYLNPFRILSQNNFSGTVEDFVRLDNELNLDSKPPWKLDISNRKVSSNHLGLEYFIDRLITKNGKDYLMTQEYLIYLYLNMESGRRCKEVPHIGSQLSVQVGTSGLVNSLDPSSEYTAPNLKIKAVASKKANTLKNKNSLLYVKYGIGSNTLPTVQDPSVLFPKDLAIPTAKTPLRTFELFEDHDYIGASSEYIGQQIESKTITDALRGDKKEFEFTLPFAPIRKGNVCLSFANKKHGITKSTFDDKRGNFISKYAEGTIDYATGECYLTTNFLYTETKVINKVYMDNQDNSIYTWTIDKNWKDQIIPGTACIRITTGKGANRRSYFIKDTGKGKFISPDDGLIVSSEINYKKGVFKVQFNKVLGEEQTFVTSVNYVVDWTPTKDFELVASYYFVLNTIEITEYGLFDESDELIAYMTFPPLEFSSTNFHNYTTMLIKKEI